jgi:hypothetical protein
MESDNEELADYMSDLFAYDEIYLKVPRNWFHKTTSEFEDFDSLKKSSTLIDFRTKRQYKWENILCYINGMEKNDHTVHLFFVDKKTNIFECIQEDVKNNCFHFHYASNNYSCWAYIVSKREYIQDPEDIMISDDEADDDVSSMKPILNHTANKGQTGTQPQFLSQKDFCFYTNLSKRYYKYYVASSVVMFSLHCN